jgi:hypothetical protein
MKNYKRIILVAVLFLVITVSLRAQDQPNSKPSAYSAGKLSSKDDEIVFVRVYESGWTKEIRGIYIFYPDGKRDKTEIGDVLDPIGNAQKVYDTLNKISKMSYNIFASNKFSGTGPYKDFYYCEYIFVKK